jgi:tight adherence protein C
MNMISLIPRMTEALNSQGDWLPKAFIFVSVFMVIFSVGRIISGFDRRMASRMRAVVGLQSDETANESGKGLFRKGEAKDKLPKLVNVIIPKSQEEQTTLQTRLINAGYYSNESLVIFYLVKFTLCVVPMVGILVLFPIFGFSEILFFVTIGLAIIGLIGPSLFLDYKKSGHQYRLRRALPDAMDLLVVCVEGGMGLQAAVKKIASELRLVHPEIALEFTLVHLQTQMGMAVGKALEAFGVRSDLEEIRQLAHVIVHSEKLGSSMAKTLKVSADSLRTRRQQQAEAKAQKAAVKIMIPTVLFIFPAIFVVVLAPALFQFTAIFASMNK